jgi:hypothetical protein
LWSARIRLSANMMNARLRRTGKKPSPQSRELRSRAKTLRMARKGV